MQYTVMIVEDDEVIAEMVKEDLERWDYEVWIASDLKNVAGQVERQKPDLILLDINLPFYNGFYWCKEIRTFSKVPIIFLSSADDNMNIVMAMDMGGDDFIAKPFDSSVLTAKVNAMMRRSYAYRGSVEILRAGEVSLNLADAALHYQEQQLELTKNEFKIMKMLMENAGSLVSRDRLIARLWDDGDFIDDNTLTVNVTRIRKAQEGEYDPAEYIPASKYDREEMYQELVGYINTIQEPHLKQLTCKYFVEDAEFIKEFKQHSAAKSVHHGFVGGLLQHTLAVTRMCDFFAKNYPILDRDLLITAAIFHDIGKIWELSDFPSNDYTDEGQLLGHIFLGAELIGREAEKIPGFPEVLARELRHCILAHHGELEYGSPKKPAMAEAMALNFADNADAKLETMTEVYDKAEPTTEWLGYNRLLESNVRQSSGYIQKRK